MSFASIAIFLFIAIEAAAFIVDHGTVGDHRSRFVNALAIFGAFVLIVCIAAALSVIF